MKYFPKSLLGGWKINSVINYEYPKLSDKNEELRRINEELPRIIEILSNKDEVVEFIRAVYSTCSDVAN